MDIGLIQRCDDSLGRTSGVDRARWVGEGDHEMFIASEIMSVM